MTDSDRPATEPSEAEALLAKALRAHAARAASPGSAREQDPPEEPTATEVVQPTAERTATVAPVDAERTAHTAPVGEQTTSLAPVPVPEPQAEQAPSGPSGWPADTQDRMLAPHDVDSSREIEAEFGYREPVTAARRRAVPGPLPVRWIVLLAVLLGLAAGAIAGLLSVL